MSSDRQGLFRYLRALKRRLTTYTANDNIYIARETTSNDAGTQDYYIRVTDLASQIAASVPPTATLQEEVTTFTYDDLSFMGPSGSPGTILPHPGAIHEVISVTGQITGSGNGTLTGTWNVDIGYPSAGVLFGIDSGTDALNFFNAGGEGVIRPIPRRIDGASYAGSEAIPEASGNLGISFTDDPGTTGTPANISMTFRVIYWIYNA